MEIGPISNKPNIPRADNKAQVDALPDPSVASKKDRVEISIDARRRLAEMADAALHDEKRVQFDLIRTRIAEGFYSRPDVKEQIADNLMDDLD